MRGRPRDEEISNRLRLNAGRVATADLAALMGLSIVAVESRIRRLGLLPAYTHGKFREPCTRNRPSKKPPARVDAVDIAMQLVERISRAGINRRA